MVNQLLGVRSDEEVNEMAQLFSDFVDGCLSIPINLKGFAYHTAMKVTCENTCLIPHELLSYILYIGLSDFLCYIFNPKKIKNNLKHFIRN
jgi:hypothetical protein